MNHLFAHVLSVFMFVAVVWSAVAYRRGRRGFVDYRVVSEIRRPSSAPHFTRDPSPRPKQRAS